MALTKTKTAVVCALVLSAPVLMQTQQLKAARAEQVALTDRIGIEEERTAALRERMEQAERRRVALGELKVQLQARSEELARASANVKPREDLYRWSDSSDYVRLPKSILSQVQLTSISSTNPETKRVFRSRAIDAEGNLSPVLVEALGLDGEQQGAIKAALAYSREQFAMLEKQRMHLTNAMPPGIMMDPEKSPLYTLVTPTLKEEGAEIRRQLLAEWTGAVGAERAEILMEQGHAAFDRGLLEFGQRERWTTATRTIDGRVRIGRSWPKGGISTGGNISTGDVSDLPEPLQRFFAEGKESNE